MLSLPVNLAALACLFLFHNAGTSRLMEIVAGSAISIAVACFCYSLVRGRRLRARTRQLQQQVDSRTRQAEEALRTKSLFLTNMSHEIRTPMNGILGMASLLAQTSLTKEQYGYIETIRSCGDTLLTVINNILDFSSIESGKITLDEKITDLRSCVEEVLEIFMTRTLQAGILLHCEIDEEVPARILTDSGRIRQILINLVGNSVKFTRQGEIRVRVYLTGAALPADATPDHTEIGFEVIDTGIGIEAGQFDRLFQTGLGLAISDRLVHLLKGRIRVESECGKGSRFSFTILARPATLKVASPGATTIPRLAEKYPLQILLAEDNPINRQLAVLILDKMGYIPGIAENGKEVLDQLQKEPFDLIFMDIQMPEMDGLEATRHIRAGAGHQPVIIAMTANTTRKDREECLNEGMNDYLSKPVHLEELIGMLESWGQRINNTRTLPEIH